MKKREKTGLDIEIDEMTNSIKNVISGDSFSTDISLITKADLKNITQKDGWQFDWKLELKHLAKGDMRVMLHSFPNRN